MSTWKQEELSSGKVAYDSQAKELVLISNGKCILDHSTSEAYRQSHMNGGMPCDCIYRASEAQAIRAIGVDDDGTLLMGWTYRGVNPDCLSPAKMSRDDFVSMMNGKIQQDTGENLKKNKVQKVKFIGRA